MFMSCLPHGFPWFPSHVSIVHRFRQVLQATSCVRTEMLLISSSWTSKACSSMWRGPKENIAYELVLTSPACLVCRTWMVLEMGGRWLYTCCFEGRCFQDLFIAVCSILLQFLSSFFSLYAFSASVWCIHTVVYHMTVAWKNCALFHQTGLTSIWLTAYR